MGGIGSGSKTPSRIWTPQIQEVILSMVAAGETWKKITAVTGIDIRRVWELKAKDTNFQRKLVIATEIGHETQADRLATAHEDIPDPIKARLFSDNQKWLLARRAAHKFGDRLDVTVGQTIDVTEAIAAGKRRISGMRADQLNEIIGEIVLNQQIAQNPENTENVDAENDLQSTIDAELVLMPVPENEYNLLGASPISPKTDGLLGSKIRERAINASHDSGIDAPDDPLLACAEEVDAFS